MVIRFVGKYHAIGSNFSRLAITLDRRPKGRYPFGVFHTLLGSTLCTESEVKSDLTVDDLSWLVIFLETSLEYYQTCFS
jgi:hypothetical protein